MPEIAEVAVYAHDLNKLVNQKKLTKVLFGGEDRWRKKIVSKDARYLLKSFENNKCYFETEGKSLYLKSKRTSQCVLFKLGMTGMFQLQLEAKHRHNFLTLDFDGFIVYYLDYRRFGRISVAKDEDKSALAGFAGKFKSMKKGEVEVLAQTLSGTLKKPKISWLLDHGSKTGVGNYLANEALGRLNLNPFTPCKNFREAVSLLMMVINVATLSYKKGGNSFKGGYYRLTGAKGSFFKYCLFYRNPKIPHMVYKGRPLYSNFVKKD
jgi:formamidopyrimidine-DNA glycosylase